MSETSWGLEAPRDLSSDVSSHIWELLLSKIFFSPNINVPIDTHALIPGMISLTKIIIITAYIFFALIEGISNRRNLNFLNKNQTTQLFALLLKKPKVLAQALP